MTSASGHPKVLVISTSWPPVKTGGANYALRYCRELVTRGMEVHVLTRQRPDAVTDPTLTVAPIMRDWSWRSLPRLMRFVDRLGPDAIVLHFMGRIYDNHPMVTLLPALLKRRRPELRFITMMEYASGTEHIHWRRLTAMGHRWFARRVGWEGLNYEFGVLLRDSDAVMALCQSHQQRLCGLQPGLNGRCHLTPPPPLMAFSEKPPESARLAGRKALGVEPDRFLFAYFGYIYPYKGLETLIQAAAIVDRQAPDRPWRLGMLGGAAETYLRDLGRPDYPEQMRRLAEQHGIADRLIWSGYMDEDSISDILHAVDCCVLPFDSGVHLNNSSFAAVVAHGIPVLTTGGPNTDEPFEHGHNCILAEPKNAENLAQWMLRIMDDQTMRAQLRAGGIQMAQTWFSWDRTMKITMEAMGIQPLEGS
ncbi:MAG: glycosyltransferase family 4 protein [Phycisphaeraceae bacterium]|nr:glycosyltransferase family 4 protein [Phycisphaeraceae bacterium]